MGTREVMSRAAVLLICALFAACGDDADKADSEAVKQMQAFESHRMAQIEKLVDDGVVPPVATRLYNPNGTLNVDFIDGPNGDNDVVRSSQDGATGKKLEWDLDQDGKIERSERTITERELYDATLGYQ
jgi:hypothetical protein